ncbi:MAG: universal stress protein [Myxococcota bacterium]
MPAEACPADVGLVSVGGLVLVPVDFSPHARAAAVRACELARACEARVRLIHGVDAPDRAAPGPEAKAPAAGAAADDRPAGRPGEPASAREDRPTRTLEAWCAELAGRAPRISASVEQEDPVALIARHVQAEDVMLVVMGMHGFHDVSRMFFGSVADRALRTTRVPMMLVKENERDASTRIRRILLATDFSRASEHALCLAIHWARRLEADVEVLHAIQDPEEEPRYRRPRDSASRSARQRANALEGLRSILSRSAAAGVRAVADLTYGSPSVEIVKHAARARADLVVMGLRDRAAGSAGGYGSVTERVIRHAKCSVLVAPEDDRIELWPVSG